MNQPMEDVLAKLSGSDRSRINQAVATLSAYTCFHNESAYQGLLDFCKRLPGAEELENDLRLI